MSVSWSRLCVITLVTLTSVAFFTLSKGTTIATPVEQVQYSIESAEVPTLSSASWLVFDWQTGDILIEEAADTVRPIASITKLISASVFFDSAELAATTSIMWSDLNTYGEAGRLSYGEVYTYRELLFPLLLESSNDAASAMVRVESDLVARMNDRVAAYELAQTTLIDASGLSTANVSTARDIAVFSRLIAQDTPHIFDITQLSSFYSADNGWLNNSPYVADPTYLGGKHGYLEAAGRTAIAIFAEPMTNEVTRELGYVLLGSTDLTSDMELLRDYVRTHVRYE